MSTKDISRFLFQPAKHYSSVRMQQGRVILDSDWNESERIDDEQERRTLLDMICSKGTSNKGFRVGTVEDAEVEPPLADPVATYDFDFENGSFYIGGLRFETDGGPESFLKQIDWLQIDALAANLPERPLNLPVGEIRRDLVYLRGWEQSVTSIEDSELRERALGGPDTSVRMRRMRRVEVLTNVPDGCAAAFSALQAKLTAPIAPDAGTAHEFDLESCELKSKARLTVALNPDAITEDPCKPAVPGGYLGADNQTLRVQLTATNRFIWGYDNASPLYRVQVENIPNAPGGVDGTRRKIRFLTVPRDQLAQPLAGQAVEIIPWGALLPNKEKVAEFQGQFFTVETSFDPEDGSLTITEPVAEEAVQWLAAHSQFWSDLDAPRHQQYFYLRLWTGGSGDAVAPDLQFTPGVPVALKGTGLSVVFSDEGLPGDFWIIAARPSTPNLVVPWELLKTAPPAGPRYFFAPLALIQWRADQTGVPRPTVHDCRERFRPLCDIRGCCTVTVGDGVSSRGDFDSIEEAIAHLPEPGGEICLLPGLHETNAVLLGRRNVIIKGCGNQTVVIPRKANRQGPIFQVVDSQRITLRDMVLVTLTGTAIVLESSKPGALKEVDISYNRILAFTQAIQVRRGVDIHIHDNRIRILDREGADVAIQILAEDALIERNDIGVVPAAETQPPDPPEGTPDPTTPCVDPEVIFLNPAILSAVIDHVFRRFLVFIPVAPFRALGGIQIVAASERVKVLDNKIVGGAGNGITLGGALPVPIILTVDASRRQPQVIESTEGSIRSFVQQDGVGSAGIGLVFTREDGKTQNAVSGAGGFLNVPTEQNRQTVFVSSPGLAIDSVETGRDEFGQFQRINVIKLQAAEPDDALAFLYEIQIDRNEISNMGLSGIGFPIVPATTPGVGLSEEAAALVALVGNPVVTLGIDRNHIHDCLQNPFDGVLRAEATRRGFGGISLGFCENVTISNNRIERNGTSHINPVCGVFFNFVEKLDIHHNHILNNGPLISGATQALEAGLRGGISLFAASFGIDELFLRRDAAFDIGLHAARVHDNVVHQPAGPSLRLLGIGPCSICDNLFSTELTGLQTFERLGGTVLVLTLGGTGRLPTGLLLFNSNQSQLGADATSLTSQLIWSTDDIGFDGNQSVALTDGLVLNDRQSVFANTFLISRTLRATDSRFKETPGRRPLAVKISLMTLTSLLNNTNDNQGDHCIFATNTAPGRLPDIIGNQVVDATLCRALNISVAAPLTAFSVSTTILDR
ncbi:MAG TPA: DUF6519 domain-containing protein [Blastocatellia bacterium]|nr:DUF6519 domain-containing protein [Blastocatellia bacterium]